MCCSLSCATCLRTFLTIFFLCTFFLDNLLCTNSSCSRLRYIVAPWGYVHCSDLMDVSFKRKAFKVYHQMDIQNQSNLSQAILSTTCHVIKGVRAQDLSLRSAFCTAIAHFSTAILDYVSNIGEMLDTTVTVAHFNTEANSIYETLFTSWLQAGGKEITLRLQVS